MGSHSTNTVSCESEVCQNSIGGETATMLGLSRKGNNLKLAVANFLLIFGVQIAFKIDEILNTGRLPTEFEFVKVVSNSLVITLIFYGYNKLTEKKE